MPDMESVITHLMIIRTWTSFARERDLRFFTAKHLEDMETWADEAIALLKEQDTMHWISVKDRLPTYAELKDDCVLVLFDDGTICSTGFDECIEGESIFGEWRQNFDPVTLGATDSYWMPLEGVTHWIPIPKLMQKGR